MLRRRTTASVAVLISIGAACGGSDADTADTTSPAPATTDAAAETAPIVTDPAVTDPVVTDPVATDPVDSGPPATDPEREPGELVDPATIEVISVVEQLDRLPLSAANAVLADDGQVLIESTDFVASAAMLGLEPASADPGGLDTFLDVTDASSVEAGGSGLGTMRMVWPDLIGEAEISDTAPEFGFSLHEVDAFATIASFPPAITVVSGDLTPSAELVDLGNGLLSAGSGPDLSNDLENRTPARPLGRPHRVGATDGQIAISLSTPVIEEWLAGGPTLATDPTVLAAAEALDRANVVSSMIHWGDLAASSELVDDVEADALLQVPFDSVGIGATAVDGLAATIVAYVYSDEAAAESALSEVESLWRDGTFFMRRLPISELFDVVSVERSANTVVVTALVDDATTTRSGFDLVHQGELVLAHA